MTESNLVPEREVLVRRLPKKCHSQTHCLIRAYRRPRIWNDLPMRRASHRICRYFHKRVLQLVVAERRSRRQSLLLFLFILVELDGDIYVVLLPCVYIIDGARGFLGELFFEISDISVLGRAASGPVSTTTIATTASASPA